MTNAFWHNAGFGMLVTFLIIGYMLIRVGHQRKTKDNSLDLTASLICTSQNSIFSLPANKRCALSALKDGLSITLLSKPKTTYLLKYNHIIKFYFDEGDNSEPQTTIENLPDYIYVEYQGDDDLVYQFRFSQTQKDKIHNQRVNEQKNIIILVNSHMQKK